MVSQDGGISFVSKSWNGNTSDTHGFQKRAEALMRAFKDTPSPRDLVADAKLYCEDNAAHLAKFGFITRIPATLKVVSQVIGQALQGAPWQSFDANTRYQSLALCHYGMAQRWLVVSSQAALERADATLKRATQREEEAITKQLFHHETVPNQINQPTASPTLRWVFQLLEGIHRVRMTVQGQVHDLIEGLNDVQIKLLRLLGNEVCRLYQISTG